MTALGFGGIAAPHLTLLGTGLQVPPTQFLLLLSPLLKVSGALLMERLREGLKGG